MITDPELYDLIEKTGNRFTLIVESSKRARQIIDGSTPLVECENENPLTQAVNEIDQEKIVFIESKESI
jgi:DNA-directed RNA polymerase subunit omega